MRPVIKPNPTAMNNVPAYTYHTQASLNTNVVFMAGAVPTSFNQQAPYTRTVNQLLNILLRVYFGVGGGSPYTGGTLPQHATATMTIETRLRDPNATPPGYRSANPQLDLRLGDYCSFCEIYKPGHEIDVEHRLAKSEYPVGYVWWGNFLQSCSRCNSIKGINPRSNIAMNFTQAPERATAYPFAPITPLPVAPQQPNYRINEHPIMQKALEHYFWPDLDSRSFRRVTYKMKNKGNFYANITPADAANTQNSLVYFANYAVRANVFDTATGAVVMNVDVEITAERNNAEAAASANIAATAASAAANTAANLVAARTAAGRAASDTSPAIGIAINDIAQNTGGNAATVAAAVIAPPAITAAAMAHQAETDRTLTLTGLDLRPSARAGYRTSAWFTILQLVKSYQTILAPHLTGGLPQATITIIAQTTFDTFWVGLLVTAKRTGFYSTIVELLRQFPYPANVAQPGYAPAGGFATLADRFIYDSNPANAGTTNKTTNETIVGTDVTHIP